MTKTETVLNPEQTALVLIISYLLFAATASLIVIALAAAWWPALAIATIPALAGRHLNRLAMSSVS